MDTHLTVLYVGQNEQLNFGYMHKINYVGIVVGLIVHVPALIAIGGDA